jgi:hypothetical protein
MRKVSQHLSRPDWWVAIFTGLLAFTTLGAVWYAHEEIDQTLQEAFNQRQHELESDKITHLLELVKEFDQEPLATYRKELAYKRLHTKEDDPYELYRILDFFETVGRLSERGYLDDEDIWHQFGYWILHIDADEDMRANVLYEQKQNPNEYATYLKLVEKLKVIDAAHGGYQSHLTKENVTDFYREEQTIVAGTPIPQERTARPAN